MQTFKIVIRYFGNKVSSMKYFPGFTFFKKAIWKMPPSPPSPKRRALTGIVYEVK